MATSKNKAAAPVECEAPNLKAEHKENLLKYLIVGILFGIVFVKEGHCRELIPMMA